MGHGLWHNNETGRKSFWENCQEIDSMLQRKDWIMGSRYTFTDPTRGFLRLGRARRISHERTQRLPAMAERMLKRPTVRKIVEAEHKIS
jgi:glutathione S-transferase